MYNPEMEVRAAINTTTNVTAGFDATFGVEIMKAVDQKIVDILNNQTPMRNMIPRVSMNGQLTYNWNVRPTNNSSSAFYADGGTNTAATGTKKQLIAVAKSFRTDWEVTGLFQAASASYYDAVTDEVSNAAVAHANKEEKQVIGGTDAGAYGDAAGFLGMKQLIDSFVGTGDTTTVYGDTRAATKTYLDSQFVDGGANALDLTELDAAYTQIVKAGSTPFAYVCSPDKADEISQLLQAQQRFVGVTQVAGGFQVMTYRGIPILSSIYMDKAGSADTDTAIFVLGTNNWEMRVLLETTNVIVANTRSDVTGGYLKNYEVLVTKDLTKNCLLFGLTA